MGDNAMDTTNMNFTDYSNYPGYMTVDYSQLIQTYYSDVTYLVDILQKITGTYTALVGSADGFNRIALAKKGDIEDAIDRAEALGKVIDNIIDMLETQVILYANYARIKNEYITNNLPHTEIIKSDIEHHIKHEHHEHHDD
jgi:hypothetical protein